MSTEPNELEIDQNVAYHQRFWQVQRVGWIIWGLVLLAAFIGLVGPGVKGERTLSDPAAKISLTYEPFVHSQSPVEIKIQIPPALGSNAETRLAFNRASIEAIESLVITPEPDWQGSTGEKILFTFHRTDPQEPMAVMFRYKTKKMGKAPIQIQLNDHPALLVEQFSFP